MFLSDLFIKRPVFALVVSLLIVVGGVMALRDLPVRELPDIDASVVTITTSYTGAAPAIIDTEITEVIEGAVARIDGVQRIESNSREGVGQTRVTFTTDRDIDSAAADVRDAVGSVANRLPDEADEPRVVKADSDSQPVLRISLTSDRLSDRGSDRSGRTGGGGSPDHGERGGRSDHQRRPPVRHPGLAGQRSAGGARADHHRCRGRPAPGQRGVALRQPGIQQPATGGARQQPAPDRRGFSQPRHRPARRLPDPAVRAGPGGTGRGGRQLAGAHQRPELGHPGSDPPVPGQYPGGVGGGAGRAGAPAPAIARGGANDRGHRRCAVHPGQHRRGGDDAADRGRRGGAGDFYLPLLGPGDPDPDAGHSRVGRRLVHAAGGAGLFDQPADAAGADSGHRPGGGRRHRGAGERPAPGGSRRTPAGRRLSRHAASHLRRARHQRGADRGLRAAVPARWRESANCFGNSAWCWRRRC